MDTNVFMPKKIIVGYKERKDTYDGKLSYVTCYDEKDKLRKEKSWNNWRDSNIPAKEFLNEPTSGFVLNKKVGGHSSGWNFRQTYIRVYDPRGFEFEITVENLLYILESTSFKKGEGFEGEFVYGWCGTDLVLVPVTADDYEEMKSYSDKRYAKKLRKKDFVIGDIYTNLHNDRYVYLGVHEYSEEVYIRYKERNDDRSIGEHHVFIQ